MLRVSELVEGQLCNANFYARKQKNRRPYYISENNVLDSIGQETLKRTQIALQANYFVPFVIQFILENFDKPTATLFFYT